MFSHHIRRFLSVNSTKLVIPPFKYRATICRRSLSSNDDFRKTLHEMKNRAHEEPSTTKNESEEQTTNPREPTNSSFLSQAKEWTINSSRTLLYNIRLAYDEMVSDNKDSILTKKVHQAESFRKKDTDVDADVDESSESKIQDEKVEHSGPSAIVLMKEPKGAWEQMKERLQDSPFIREILKKSKVVGNAAVQTDLGKKAQNVGQSVKDKVGDLREFWETSQNPLVYTLSGVWDNMTGETEEGIALNEIKKFDPKFNKEEWALEVKTSLAPTIIKAHLQGDLKILKKWLGEAAFNKLAADIRMRKADGITFDSNILDIDENQLIVRYLEGGGPVIVGVYMVQQINCIKNRKGEIIEGNESDIRAKFYSIAFQQNYDEDSQIVSWKVVDYEFAGDMPYY